MRKNGIAVVAFLLLVSSAHAQDKLDAVRCKYFTGVLYQYAQDLEKTTNYASDMFQLFDSYCIQSKDKYDKKLCGPKEGIVVRQFYEAVDLRQLFYDHYYIHYTAAKQFCPTGMADDVVKKSLEEYARDKKEVGKQ